MFVNDKSILQIKCRQSCFGFFGLKVVIIKEIARLLGKIQNVSEASSNLHFFSLWQVFMKCVLTPLYLVNLNSGPTDFSCRVWKPEKGSQSRWEFGLLKWDHWIKVSFSCWVEHTFAELYNLIRSTTSEVCHWLAPACDAISNVRHFESYLHG
mgnify:CR=1 FL=1